MKPSKNKRRKRTMRTNAWNQIIKILIGLGKITLVLVAPFWFIVELIFGKPNHYVLNHLDQWSFAHVLGSQITTVILYKIFVSAGVRHPFILSGYIVLLIWVIFWEEMVDGLGKPFPSDPNGADISDMGADLLGVIWAGFYVWLLNI